LTSSQSPGKESTLESAISLLLILGVISSLFLVGIGILLFHHDFGHFALSQEKRMFIQDKNFFQFLYDLLREGFLSPKSIWLMTTGIAILILTPYVRVILSLLYFLAKKDFPYAAITLFVFVLLTVSLLWH
jgi:uncharacterized membrane protein